METLAAVATHRVATPPSSADRAAFFSRVEPEDGRWPLGARLAFLVGASLVLWTLIGWAALRVIALG